MENIYGIQNSVRSFLKTVEWSKPVTEIKVFINYEVRNIMHFILYVSLIHLCGKYNNQSFRYWSAENPNDHYETSLHPKKWCGVARFGAIGSYFFLDQRGNTVTVNSERHV